MADEIKKVPASADKDKVVKASFSIKSGGIQSEYPDGIVVDKIGPFKIGGVELPALSTNPNEWNTSKEEVYRPDKGKFILNFFRDKLPAMKFDNVEQCYKLCSRNKSAASILADANGEYASIEKMPQFYRDTITSSEYNRISGKIREANSIQSSLAESLNNENIKYRAAIRELQDEADSKLSKLFSDKLLRVVALSSQELPATLGRIIDDYSPVNDVTYPSQQALAKELLVNYKVALLAKLKENPNIDIDMLIEENSLK